MYHCVFNIKELLFFFLLVIAHPMWGLQTFVERSSEGRIRQRKMGTGGRKRWGKKASSVVVPNPFSVAVSASRKEKWSSWIFDQLDSIPSYVYLRSTSFHRKYFVMSTVLQHSGNTLKTEKIPHHHSLVIINFFSLLKATIPEILKLFIPAIQTS